MIAGDVFDRARSEGWQLVKEWIASRQEETSGLDFKQKTDSSTAELGQDDKKNIAKAVSAFANTSGGVLVFGISTAEGNKDIPDRASAIVKIQPLAQFEKKVEDTIRSLNDPPVAGFDRLRIEDPEAPGTGVLVIKVPQSEGGPHRAASPAGSLISGLYYMRTNTSAVVMPHPQLAAMFGRRPLPKLEVLFRLTHGSLHGGAHGKSVDVHVDVLLHNTGRGLARFPYLGLNVPSSYVMPMNVTSSNLSILVPKHSNSHEREFRIFAGGADAAIHPGQIAHVHWAERKINESDGSVPDFSVRYRVAAEGLAMVDGDHLIKGDEILAFAKTTLANWKH